MNLWTEMMDEIISGLVTGGFNNMFIKELSYPWNKNQLKVQPDKMVLDMDHIVFRIYLIGASFGVLVLAIEILSVKTEKHRKLQAVPIIVNIVNFNTWLFEIDRGRGDEGTVKAEKLEIVSNQEEKETKDLFIDSIEN